MSHQQTVPSIIEETLHSLRYLAEKGCPGFDCTEHTLSILKAWSHSPRHGRQKTNAGQPVTAVVQPAEKNGSRQPPPTEPARSESPVIIVSAASLQEASAPPRPEACLSQTTDSLDAINTDMEDCKRCKLSATRSRIVFGTGNPSATLMFVGEAPGFDEDQQGLPFVGKAGQLLTRIIQAMNLTREEVYICNIVKCRPPGNRNPEPDEIQACVPFLNRQIAAVRPEFICALGKFAAQTLLQTNEPISTLRGRFFDYKGIRLIPTFHPSYLLRSPDKKREVWEDMKLLMNEMSS
jgi:DNA polymerase